MNIFRTLLASLLVNFHQAEVLQSNDNSVNTSFNPASQGKSTQKDVLEFWTGFSTPTSTTSRRTSSSRNSEGFQKHYHNGKRKRKLNVTIFRSNVSYSRPKHRIRQSGRTRNASFDKWANRTYILRSETYVMRRTNESKHKNRSHKFERPTVLYEINKTLSKLTKIMRKPLFKLLFRRIGQDTPKTSKKETPILSTEDSLYTGKSKYGSSDQKWPKVRSKGKPPRGLVTRPRRAKGITLMDAVVSSDETGTSRTPKGVAKTMARNFDDDDKERDLETNYSIDSHDGTIHRMRLVQANPEATKEGTTTTTTSRTTTEESGIDPYLSPYSIKAHVTDLVSQFRNTNISVEVIGRTVSYNDIILMKVSAKAEKERYFRTEDKFLDEGPEKKIIFIVHGLTVMGMNQMPCMLEKSALTKLLSYYFAHLDKFDIFLIPMANPDGVSMEASTHWNKNMSPQSSCAGVCLDRNFDVAWNASRTTSSCSQQYPGPSPFSEEETKAVRDVIHRYSHKIVAYMHLHSATYTAEVFKGDAVLYPRGYTEVQSDDDKYIDLRGEIDEAMKNASFQVLTVAVDTLYNWYGKVSGSSVDYASSVYGIPYAMELVMQIYKDDEDAKEPDQMESAVALREVWRRVIDVIFHSVHKFVRAAGD